MTATGHSETLAPMFASLAGRGRRAAVVQFLAEGRKKLSYAGLAEVTEQFAGGARAAGLATGDRVLLYGATSMPWIVACLGSLRAGAVPVPLDTQMAADNLARIVDDSDARWAFTDEGTLPRLQEAGFEGEHRLLDAAKGDDRDWRSLCRAGEAGSEEAGAPDHSHEPDPDATALLFYTSGTTGPPKGVPLKQRHLAYQLKSLSEAGLVQSDDRMLQPLPAHHVYPLVVGTLAPLALGLTLVLPRSLTGTQLIRAIREGEVSIVIGVPRLYSALYEGVQRRLASAGKLRGMAARGLLQVATLLRRRLRWRIGKRLLAPLHRRLGGHLRVLASGGSPLDPELAWKLEGLGWQTAVGYGLTETSPLLTLNPPGGNHPASVGLPLPGTDIAIDPAAHPAAEQEERAGADDDAGFPGPGRAGVEGEILVRGAGVFDGYHNLEDKTRRAFTDGWFRTGDLGRFDRSGRLYVSGRRKTLIVTAAGENVPPGAIESAYERHAAIEEVGVLSDDGDLVAVIVPAQAAAESAEQEQAVREAVSQCAKRLPSHQRIARFELDREPLERTRLGKIQRHRLEARYEALRKGDAESGSRRDGPADVDDLSAQDRQLLEDRHARLAWEALTEAYPDRPVHPDADLRLDLGIDSLGWLDLTVELAQRANVELDEERIAEFERVRDLLEAMTELREDEDLDPRAPLRDPESVLSAEQRRWLAPLPRPAAWTARVLRRCNRRLMAGAFDLEVAGRGRLPDSRPLIFAPNHLSFLDPLALTAALPESLVEQLFWGGWTGVVFRNRALRLGARLARAVPVDPERAVVSSLAFGAAVMKNGDALAWFPEGERSRDGELGEFRPGLGMLLNEYPEVPVVPVRITGTYAAWPSGQRLPRRHRAGVTFGEPRSGEALDRNGEGEEARVRITQALRCEVAALDPPWEVDADTN